MSTTADVGAQIGDAIRARRHALGLRLIDVAARTGLSHPFLSQLERGLARPSMRSLTAIANALGTTAQALMSVTVATEPPVSVMRHDAGSTVDSPGGTVRSLVYGERSMLPVEYVGAPARFDEYFVHPGEEFIYIVAGTIEIDVDGDLNVLTRGESIYYPGGLRHRWRSVSTDEVKIVAVQRNE